MSTARVSRPNTRRHPRVKLPPMYTVVRARPRGASRFCWTGYIYDISASGMRFELDRGLEEGCQIEIRAVLPGETQTSFRATGHVVRRHEDPYDPGPVRMGLEFDAFPAEKDHDRLNDYLGRRAAKAA